MQSDRLDKMINGWFVGGFTPTAFKTQACEVAVKNYVEGDCEGEHYHKIATEITLVLKGQVRMLGKLWSEGDIITIEPNCKTEFEALTDATTVVVKVPGALNDKYLV